MANLYLTLTDRTDTSLITEPSESNDSADLIYIYTDDTDGVWLTRKQIKKLRKTLKRALAE